MNEIERDEHLDSLNPLRHFQESTLIPSQIPTTHTTQTTLTFPTDISITLTIDAQPGCGGIAWPAGQVLSTYLTSLPPGSLSKHESILELGSGTGLVGLVAGTILQRESSSTTTRIWITDQAPLLPIMSVNTSLNALSPLVVPLELSWGTPSLPKELTASPLPTLLLLADCVYFEPSFPLLVSTLTLLSTPSTTILFCYKKRRKADKRFFTLLKKEFTWSEIDDDPYKDTYARDAISLLKLVKKS